MKGGSIIRESKMVEILLSMDKQVSQKATDAARSTGEGKRKFIRDLKYSDGRS